MFLKNTVTTAIVSAAFTFLTYSAPVHAATDCRPPLAPTIPNGTTATKEEILAALKIVRNDFQPAIKNFQNCVSTEKEAVGDVASEAQITEWDQLFDAAYVLETQVAENMNMAIRAYKARVAKEKPTE